MIRRIIVVLLSAGAVAGAVALDRRPVEPAVFAIATEPGTPVVPGGDAMGGATWFCGGTPALGAADGGEYGGEVVVTNTGESPSSGTVSIFSVDAEPVRVPVSVEPRSQSVVDLDAVVTGNYVSAMVELDRTTVSVEQRALHPAGNAVVPCSNSTSDTWFAADGFTAEGSDLRLLITNPYLSPAIVDIGISTQAGPRTPTTLQGFVVPPLSLRVVNLEEAGFRDEPVVGFQLRATTGRVVVAKDQHFLGAGRLAHVTTMAAPSLDSQWWFADGEKGAGISESLVLFNPTDSDVEADIMVLGLGTVPSADGTVQVPLELAPTTLTIPSNEVVLFDTAGLPGLPDGTHGFLVTTRSSASLVVERVITRPSGESVATSVVLGAQPRALSSRWIVPVTPSIPLEDALVVLNASAEAGTVDILSIGPGGEEPLPGLSDVPLAANSVLTIDLLDAVSVGRPVIVVSDQPIVVERRLERSATSSGRGGSLALPE